MPVEISDRGLSTLVLYHRLEGDLSLLTRKEPVPMLCVANRTLVEHQLSWLSDMGFRKVGLSFNDRSKEVERLVNNGERWGVQVQHLMDPPNLSLQERLRKHDTQENEGLLIVEGNAAITCDLPRVLDDTTVFQAKTGLLPILFACAKDLRHIIAECEAQTVAELCAWVADTLKPNKISVNAFYHPLKDLPEFLHMNQEMLGHPEVINFHGLAIQDGVRHARRSQISPKAEFKAPVLIGEDVDIKREAEIGPNVLLGDRCFIDRGAHLANSVIGPDTYVGRNTSFVNKYVSRNYVVDMENKTAIFVDDPLILGDLTRTNNAVDFIERSLALLALVLLLPLLLLLLPLHRILHGQWMISERILKQPVKRNLKSGYDYTYTTWQRFNFGLFCLDMIPSLGNIVSGKIRFVGNPPLVEDDLEGLEPMWRGDQLRGKAGLTGMVQQLDWESTSPEEVFATTIYYNATRSTKGDCLLFFKALVPGVHRYKRKTT